MVRKLVTATVSAALCMMSVAPGVAAAQDYRSTAFEAPRGVTATVNLRVPLGQRQTARPSYGLTLGYGQTVAPGVDGRTTTRAINLADFRFSDGELSNARVASLDLANLDRDRRMNLAAGGKKTWLILGILIGLGIILCVTEFCNGDEDEPATGGPTAPTG